MAHALVDRESDVYACKPMKKDNAEKLKVFLNEYFAKKEN
jgi:hypothetical protein